MKRQYDSFLRWVRRPGDTTVVNPKVLEIQSGSVGGYIMTDGMKFKHSSIMKVKIFVALEYKFLDRVDILVIFIQQL